MATINTINDLTKFSNEELKDRKVILTGKMVTDLEGQFFHFADSSNVVQVELLQEKHLGLGFIKRNMFLRLINPQLKKIEGNYILQIGQKSKIVPSAKVDITTNLSQITRNLDPGTKLEIVNNMEPMQKVAKIVVKITKMCNPMMMKYGKKVFCTIKDKHNTTAHINFWNNFVDQVEVGQILEITNLEIENYPKEDNRPKYIKTTKNTKLTDVTEEEYDNYLHVELSEFSFSGLFDCIFSCNVYDACPKCRKSIEKTEKNCQTCRIVNVKTVPDFVIEFQLIKLNEDDEEFEQFTAFKKNFSHLEVFQDMPDDILSDKKAIQEILKTEMTNKSIRVDYYKSQYGTVPQNIAEVINIS